MKLLFDPRTPAKEIAAALLALRAEQAARASAPQGETEGFEWRVHRPPSAASPSPEGEAAAEGPAPRAPEAPPQGE